MQVPDDFGLTPAATLTHTARSTRPPGFGQFFDRWTRRVAEVSPSLQEIGGDESGPAGAPGVTHVYESVGGVRIGCRLSIPNPEAPPTALVVTSHGYHVDPGAPLSNDDPWLPRGLAVMKIRVRGYPGSQFDTGDLTTTPGGYITRGLALGQEWIVEDCVADLVNAVRAARDAIGPGVPIMLHGESFGGGLAVIAAALLANIEPVSRLAIALPTLGDWAWRATHPIEAGAGAELRLYTQSNPDQADSVAELLPFFDSVVHAARVVCPTLCKLALRDEVVPAPTAAAVFNALGVDPGHKWRFVVETGHTHHLEGAMPDLRRHAMFERLAGAFLDPSEDLHALMTEWCDRLRPVPESA